MNIPNLRNRFALLLTILIAPFAGVSAAGLIDSSAGYSGQATGATINATKPAVELHTNVSGSEDTETSSGNTNVNTSANVNADVNSSTDNGNNAGGNGEASVSVTTGQNSSVEVSAGNSGNIIKIDRSSDEVTTTLSVPVQPREVRTSADLKAYAATALRNDENFNGVDIGDERVSVNYRQAARLLGIIPVSMNVNVTVNQDGSVDVDYPWYSFLSVTNRADLEAALENEIGSYLAGSTSGTTIATASSTAAGIPNTGIAGTAFTPSVQASLIARIQTVLKSHLTSGSGNASSTQVTSS